MSESCSADTRDTSHVRDVKAEEDYSKNEKKGREGWGGGKRSAIRAKRASKGCRFFLGGSRLVGASGGEAAKRLPRTLMVVSEEVMSPKGQMP